MPEHLIRLRGGWDVLGPGMAPVRDASSRQVILPLNWSRVSGVRGRVRLVRRFGAPPLEPGQERMVLRLEDVEGLISVALNGQEIGRPAPGMTSLEIPLREPLLRRNVLMFEVDPPVGRELATFWGAISLVVTPAGDVP